MTLINNYIYFVIRYKNLLSKCKRGFVRRENRGFLSTIQEELDSDSDDDEDYI